MKDKPKAIEVRGAHKNNLKNIDVDIPFDRQQLADFLCVERSALSAEISRLVRAGSFDCRKNHFVLR